MESCISCGNFLIHALNLFVLLILVLLFIVVRKTVQSKTKIDDYLGLVARTVNSVRYGDLSKKIEQTDDPDTEHLAESLNRMIETLNDREAMIIEYQNELMHRNKFLEAVINSLSDGLITIDDSHKILSATPKVSGWFDVSTPMGRNFEEFITIPQGKKIENLKDDDVIVKNAKSENFTASTMELKLEDKKHRFVIILKNVTNQRELENLKEDFVATLTHDLKVPVIAETNMLELLLNGNFGEVSEKQKTALKNMQISNKELLELVQTVLDTYKIKDRKIRLRKENIMARSFLGEIIEEMHPIAVKTKNSLEFNLERDIRIFADRMQLKRVMKNLIQNALSYGKPNSPIEISTGEIPGFTVIKVKDYGAGISDADISKIFNKYYSASKKFRKTGTGLGLYFSYRIIGSHGGSLEVESEEGKYTEFSVKLPAPGSSGIHFGD